MTERLDLIAVGAHPDDVEIGCGGTLALLAGQGYRVGIVDLTDGEPTPGSPDVATRIAEAHSAAEVLQARRIILDFTNRALFDTEEARIALATVIRRYQPAVVLGLAGRTPLASPDHWQAAQITDAAVFYSRLTKWDHRFDHLPPHKVQAQAYYSLMHTEFQPFGKNQFVVDISSTLAEKMRAIRCYKTQFPPEKQYVLDRAESIAKAVGLAAGLEAGEVLTAVRTLATTDPMAMLLGSQPGGQ